MLSITATQDWQNTHPGATIGLLELSDVGAPASPCPLEDRKQETVTRLRARCRGWSRQDFLSLPVMAAYARYYKPFHKTYHVLLQVESIVLKDKSLPCVAPLVDANFMAEVETFILTAGHDASQLSEPVWIDVSREGDQLIQLNGASKTLPAGDMVMRDLQGVRCSILDGQDQSSSISAGTKHVLYVSYAPQGVAPAAVEAHLQQVEANIRLISPGTVCEQRRLIQS